MGAIVLILALVLLMAALSNGADRREENRKNLRRIADALDKPRYKNSHVARGKREEGSR